MSSSFHIALAPERNVGRPLSAETPAPVNTTTAFASRSLAAARSMASNSIAKKSSILFPHVLELTRRIGLPQLRHSAVGEDELVDDVREFLDAKAVRLPGNEILKRSGRVLNRERVVRPKHDVELAAARGLVGA